MMKTLKKSLALILAVIMMLAMATTAMAADATITISGEAGTTYTLYKVLDVEANEDATAVLYTWASNEAKTAAGDKATTDDNGYVTVADAVAFAKAVLDNPGELTATTATIAAGDDETSVELADGYYVMRSSANTTPFAFSVINGEIRVKDANSYYTANSIKEKAGLPKIAKKVDDSAVSIGDTVTYTVTVTAETAGKNYTVVDTLPAGITYNNDLSIENLTKDTDYTVTTSGQTITIAFAQSYLDEVTANTDIVITYTGTVNENIKIWDDSETTTEDNNTNTAILYFGDDGTDADNYGDLSKDASAEVHSYKIDLTKTDGKDQLEGATFELYLGETKINMAGDSTTGYYPDKDGAAVITASKVVIYGLGDGSYTLKETNAPDGYTVAEDQTVTIEDDNVEVTVVNTPGELLPDTGGIGTTIFYVVGAALVIGAGAVLFTKKRRNTET